MSEANLQSGAQVLSLPRVYKDTIFQGPVDGAVKFIVMAMLVYLPYAAMLDDLTGLKIWGYGAVVSVIPTCLIVLTFLALALKRPNLAVIPFFLSGATAIVILGRVAMGLSETSSVELKLFADVRYLVLFPCFIVFAYIACQEPWFRLWAPRVFVFNGLIAAVVGILYSFGIISYRVNGSEESVRALYQSGEITRAAGLVAGSNGFANFLVLAIFICISSAWSYLFKVAVCLVLFAGILSSESRAALFAASVIVIWCTWRQSLPFWLRIAEFSLLAGVLFFTPSISRSSESFVSRLDNTTLNDDFATRVEKATSGLGIAFDSLDTVLLGVRPSEAVRANISDNSFVAVLTSVGLPLTLLFCWLLRILFRRMLMTHGQRHLAVFWFLVATTFLVNNAIYWDDWLLNIAVLYGLLIQSPRFSDRPDGTFLTKVLKGRSTLARSYQ